MLNCGNSIQNKSLLVYEIILHACRCLYCQTLVERLCIQLPDTSITPMHMADYARIPYPHATVDATVAPAAVYGGGASAFGVVV